MENGEDISLRKKQHLDMALEAQVLANYLDQRFNYEPLLEKHPDFSDYPEILKTFFLGKVQKAPLWVSSMTGGTREAQKINQILATVAGEFGFGMGLGSCRPLLESKDCFEDFNLRPLLGDKVPFLANLGICQIQEMVDQNKVDDISNMVESLKADGLMIHINPLQELFQKEGDKLNRAPIEIIKDFISKFPFKVMVKEVGQGMGPKSLEALLKLPIAGIEFGAFGGTNFSKLEMMRSDEGLSTDLFDLSLVGHTAEQMVDYINPWLDNTKMENFIISGGIKNYLDGFYLKKKLKAPCVTYGHAKLFLEYAVKGIDPLREFVRKQITGLLISEKFLTVKSRSI